jgi:hypothetical protein
MAKIAPIDLDEALAHQVPKPPSARTLRSLRLRQDANTVVEAIRFAGAAVIRVDEQEDSAAHYFAGLRNALRRAEQNEILLRKRRGRPEIVAWKARPEDAAKIETRQRIGRHMAEMTNRRRKATASRTRVR